MIDEDGVATAKAVGEEFPDDVEPEALPDRLFADVLDVLRRHFHFEEEWHYIVGALFVFQAQVALLLPAVFYLFIGGPYGQGKTTLLYLLARLTGGLLLENVSVAALARSMEDGVTVCLDEIDVVRGHEVDEVRDALLRQGYRRSAAPYVRWNPLQRSREEVPIYGPKAATFRGTLDDALQSRGFIIPTAKPVGERGYELVLANMWPDLKALPDRLRAWGEDARKTYTDSWVKDMAHSPSFRNRVRQAVAELGANRESELATVALLVAEMLGVDVVEELRRAGALARNLTGAAMAEELEELGEVILGIAGPMQQKLSGGASEVRLRQKSVRDEWNHLRKERGDPLIWDKQFAVFRRELGIRDEWLRRPGNRMEWALPASWFAALKERAEEAEDSMANSATLANPEFESEVSRVSQVSRESADRPEKITGEKVLARVLQENTFGVCSFCHQSGHNRSVLTPRGSSDPRMACSRCAEKWYDLGERP